MTSTELIDHTGLLAAGRVREVPGGQTVFAVGDRVDAIHLVRRGVVLVRSTSIDGEVAAVDVRTRGDLLDDTALLPSSPALHLDEVVALTDCELVQVPVRSFEELRDRDAAVGAAVVGQLSDQARRLSTVLIDLLGRPARSRTARRLDALGAALERTGLAGVPLLLNQRDLADFAGTTRSTLNAQLAQFQQAGAVATERGRLTIVDRAALHRFR